MSDPTSFTARGITKSFSGVDVLMGIDFAVRPGTIHGLFGHNGAGKSTLLKILAGAQPQDDGEMTLAGQAVRFASPRDALSQGIGCVYQELRLIPNMTVAENLFLGRERARAGFRDIAGMNAYCAELLGGFGLKVAPQRQVRTLSHPEKQLLEVISNLDSNARFLFLDEPTTALDGDQARAMLAKVRQIAEAQNIGIVLVSHKLDEVLEVCDEATVLAGGRVVYHATGDRISKAAIVEAIAGEGHHAAAAPRALRPEGEAFLEVRNLRGSRLKDVSLDARKGEILGLYGLVGAGRTRLLRTLYGLEDIAGGSAVLGGARYHPGSPRAAIARGVAFLTEERKHDGFIPLMSAHQNVTLSTLQRYRAGGLVSLGKARAAAEDLLRRVATRGQLDRPIQSLSGGNQQKVLFARIMAQDAALILLDEPTKGVDIGAKDEIYEIIRALAAEGRCIIVVSSEEEELMELCDRIAIFQNGRCTALARPIAEWSLPRLREAAWGHEGVEGAAADGIAQPETIA